MTKTLTGYDFMVYVKLSGVMSVMHTPSSKVVPIFSYGSCAQALCHYETGGVLEPVNLNPF